MKNRKQSAIWMIIIGAVEIVTVAVSFYALFQLIKLNNSLGLEYVNEQISYFFYFLALAISILQIAYGLLILRGSIISQKYDKPVSYLGYLLFPLLIAAYYLLLIIPTQNIANS